MSPQTKRRPGANRTAAGKDSATGNPKITHLTDHCKDSTDYPLLASDLRRAVLEGVSRPRVKVVLGRLRAARRPREF